MSHDQLLRRMQDRVTLDKDSGDIAYFHSLSLFAEYLTKIITAGLVACLGDDPDRHRYTAEHTLVRADAIGVWVDTLTTILTGSAAQFFIPAARDIRKELTERVGEPDWRYVVFRDIHAVASHLRIEDAKTLNRKAALRQVFPLIATIRNKTRGHGAITGSQCSQVCEQFGHALHALATNLQLLNTPWAHLHRNLSMKYRVTPLLGDCEPFEYLKRDRETRLSNGAHIFLGRPLPVPLVITDPEALDVLLPNGQFRASTFELLSYVTNDSRREDGSPWMLPPSRLPSSETEGRPALDLVGGVFANLPQQRSGYISRPDLQALLLRELRTTDRHPVLTLTGPGGIGKTTLALAVLHELARAPSPYEVIIWLSARDIDLLELGPRPVSPHVVTQQDIAAAAVALLEPAQQAEKDFQALLFFQMCLTNGAAGPTLFVIDNFETVESTADVFNWLDAHIRSPNKILITTRFRDFVGDYALEVGGMNDEEADELIARESARLGISSLITDTYRDELKRESDGHPYVMKIMLGEVARLDKVVKPERIVATQEHILRALFERTYATLAPGAQRLFLLLSSWRVLVPEIAVEAVALRPANERFDVAGALAELKRFSLIEEVISQHDQQGFVGVPLPAAMFGKRKLEASPFKAAVEDDRLLLMEFGAGKREDVQHGVLPRIERLISTIARKVADKEMSLSDCAPILEYLGAKEPATFVLLADLTLESGDPDLRREQAKTYLRRYLEVAEPSARERVWWRLADLCAATNDPVGEVHALSEVAQTATASLESISTTANRINNRIRELKGQRIEEAWSPEIKLLIQRVAGVMERRSSKLSGDDCSRLAWLYLNIGSTDDRSLDLAHLGLQRDPGNIHCLKLLERLQG